MEDFAELLERLILTPQRNGKLRLLEDYMRAAPDPERGYGIAAIAGELDLKNIKPAMIRALIEERMDPELFRYSYDYVGDLAETVSLAWPARKTDEPGSVPALSEIVGRLNSLSRSETPKQVEEWLDLLGPGERYALLKLITGGMRIGVSARLVKLALAGFGRIDAGEIEELWHGLTPPYEDLLAWLSGDAPKPVNAAAAPFRPVMLAHPIGDSDFDKENPEDFLAEWKWDGIRVQAVSENGTRRLYSRTGDDISGAFPDILDAMSFDGAIDGELLVAKEVTKGRIKVGSFSDLQQRLNRKTVSKRLLGSHPAFIRCYDLLRSGGQDLRPLPFSERRARLEDFSGDFAGERFDLSELLSFSGWDGLAEHRAAPPDAAIEGVMLKRRDAPYVPGRPKGQWYKWKRDPYLVDAVLMYAQRGHGKRSGYYSDFTFGCWTMDENGDPVLVPVGKAYFGFTDEELKELDRFVRNNTVERFGPVRSVIAGTDAGLVLEIAFEGLNRSTRHKSGVAMRFPRISRLRRDKPPAEADTLEMLEKLLT